MKGFLLDSSFLFALYEDEGERSRQARHSFANAFSRSGSVLIVAWPILYETFNTRFSSDLLQIHRLESEWSSLKERKQLQFLDDTPFRRRSLEEWWARDLKLSGWRGLSLVDRVLRAVLESRSPRVHALLSFDHRDFSDVCGKLKVKIVPRDEDVA
jgi:hypothetical protein